MARLGALALLLSITAPRLFAHDGEPGIKIFGFFQNALQHWTTIDDQSEHNSFSVQQLNLFFQKDLAPQWTAFVDFEILNNFSSSRRWGALNLEEAWAKYRLNGKLNLKFGLLIPTFNNLNEINNRTPVLPYLIRPLVYETSFNEILNIEDFVPERAFVQAYGFFRLGRTKLDYAAYVGNSPNVNADQLRGQTGVDTTTSFLVGGRLGLRHRELKAGLSLSYDKDDQFQEVAERIGRTRPELQGMPRVRFGGDLSYRFKNFSFEGEFITVNLDEGVPELVLDLDFYYATLGYNITDQLLLYASYWDMESHVILVEPGGELEDTEDVMVPTVGVSFDLNDAVRLKGHMARIRLTDVERFEASDTVERRRDNFSFFGLAVSVFF